MLSVLRKTIAVSLVAALCVLVAPSLTLGGGNDDPGYSGGSKQSESAPPSTPPTHGGGKGKDKVRGHDAEASATGQFKVLAEKLLQFLLLRPF
jgi:hypothetical protein